MRGGIGAPMTIGRKIGRIERLEQTEAVAVQPVNERIERNQIGARVPDFDDIGNRAMSGNSMITSRCHGAPFVV